VRPFPLTRTVPAFPTFCADTVYAAAEPGAAVALGVEADVPVDPVEPDELAEWVDDPHAAPTTASPATATNPRVNACPRPVFVLFMNQLRAHARHGIAGRPGGSLQMWSLSC